MATDVREGQRAAQRYTLKEMMAATAARELRDGEVVFVGIGLPNLACNLARATHAPNLVLIYESGAVGAVPERLPVSIGDPALVTGGDALVGLVLPESVDPKSVRVTAGTRDVTPVFAACSAVVDTATLQTSQPVVSFSPSA